MAIKNNYIGSMDNLAKMYKKLKRYDDFADLAMAGKKIISYMSPKIMTK
jgi:hypothetical protein